MQQQLKNVVRAGLHDLGAIRIVRAQRARKLRVLMYHHFPLETSGIRRQCEHIRRYYSPVSMAQVAQAFANREPLPPNAVAVTVDDGYRDFLLHGFPAFREFGIRPTVFLVSDFIDRKCWLWWNEIEYAIENTREERVAIAIKNRSFSLPIVTQAEKTHAIGSLVEALKLISNDQREASKQRILSSLAVTFPATMPNSWEPLTWDEVRYLAACRVEFGAHTRTHPILASIVNKEKLRDEIAGSKRRIESELGVPIVHFCYPNGRRQDVGAEAVACARESGFQTALTTERGMNVLSESDPFLLRRLGVDTELPPNYFAELLAGVKTS